MKKDEFFSIWSRLHGDANISGIVKGWLSISYVVVKPLSKARVTPNILTIFGLLFGVLLYVNAETFWAPAKASDYRFIICFRTRVCKGSCCWVRSFRGWNCYFCRTPSTGILRIYCIYLSAI